MITITFRFHVIEKMCKLRYKQYLRLYGGEIIEFEGEAARRKPCDGGPAATRTKGVCRLLVVSYMGLIKPI